MARRSAAIQWDITRLPAKGWENFRVNNATDENCHLGGPHSRAMADAAEYWMPAFAGMTV